jgi:hypothetical protein
MTNIIPALLAYLALWLAPFAIISMAILVYYLLALARCVRDRCWQWR